MTNKKRLIGAEIPVTAAAFALLHRGGHLGDLPLPAIAALLLFVDAGNRLVRRAFSSERSVVHLHLRMATQQLGVGAIVYAIGWGPSLALGFLVMVADDLRVSGSRVWRAAAGWTVVAIAAGQLAIAVGGVASYIEEPGVHGLAALAALGTAFVIRLLGLKTAEVEREAAERGEVEAALSRSERRFRSLALNSSDVVVVTDAAGLVTYISPSVERLLGHAPEHYLGRSGLEHLHADDAAAAARVLEALASEPAGEVTVELRARHADGTFRWQEYMLRNLLDDPDVGGIVVNFRDITERRAEQERLTYDASHDVLTGLANRQVFQDRLGHALSRRARGHGGAAVLFCDLDGFKALNDRFGHAAGDQVLMEIAQRLRDAVRPADTVARIAGDEFTVLLEDLREPGEADTVARRICAALSAPVAVDGEELMVTMSIGVAEAHDADTVDALVAKADLAMYEAKNNGRAGIRRYEEANQRFLERFRLESDLPTAITRGELRLDFQPIVDTAAGDVAAVEALVRWEHPERGLLGPDLFIPIAEHTGSIIPLGRWVLEEACRVRAAWRPQRQDLVLCVNVSARQLREPTFVEDVRAALDAAGLPPRLLALELTESALIDTGRSLAVIEGLRQMGVRLVIDDFGTGYSSLAYLSRFPVDGIKIDGCFVAELGTASGYRMAKAIVELARGMDLWVVAEGVETAAQAAAVAALGCQFGQGYHFARPSHSFQPPAQPRPAHDVPAHDVDAGPPPPPPTADLVAAPSSGAPWSTA